MRSKPRAATLVFRAALLVVIIVLFAGGLLFRVFVPAESQTDRVLMAASLGDKPLDRTEQERTAERAGARRPSNPK
jgi:hypothetical protein